MLDGTTITTTCKGSEETSSITQAQDSITIKCKDFKIEADTITCKSDGKTSHESGDDFSVNSSAAMELKASDKITATASSDMALKGSTVDIKGSTGDVTISGMNVDASATSKTSISGGQVEISGDMKAELSGGWSMSKEPDHCGWIRHEHPSAAASLKIG